MCQYKIIFLKKDLFRYKLNLFFNSTLGFIKLAIILKEYFNFLNFLKKKKLPLKKEIFLTLSL